MTVHTHGVYAKALKTSSLSGFLMDIKMFFGSVFFVLKSDGVVEGGTGTIAREIGRGIDYAIGMEDSLKLKEISYIHSEASS